jgi:predicted nucleic-acid-binding Zn-ribbon protein
LARRAVLPWPPNESCKCKACRERNWDLTVINTEAKSPDDQHQLIDVTAEQKEGVQCLHCDYTVTKGKNPKQALRLHSRFKHTEMVAA